MEIDDKFARLSALRPARGKPAMPARAAECGQPDDSAGRVPGARVNRNRFGEHISMREWYATPEICSLDPRALALLLPQSSAAEELLHDAMDPARWLFLDTETTGLSGGTGTYAFLVGIAWWEARGLQVEQFFLQDLNEEHSMLLELSERMAERPVLVTFNGKSFDWPLLETRYRMTRSLPAFSPRLHLDLLHPARQLWRLRLGSVRLKDLERHVLSAREAPLAWSRHDDIDSTLIPQMYFEYLRGGSIEPLLGVFRHNQMDLRGLAALAGKILGLLESGHGGHAASARKDSRDPVEVLGLSRIMHRRGHSVRARELYEEALTAGLPRPIARLARQELAQLAKRERDYKRAVSLWDDLRGCAANEEESKFVFAEEEQNARTSAIEAAEQLAIHYEHRERLPHRAFELVEAALRELKAARRSGEIPKNIEVKLRTRLDRRLARLSRRCDRAVQLQMDQQGVEKNARLHSKKRVAS